MGRARGVKREWPSELRDLQSRVPIGPEWHTRKPPFPRSAYLERLAREGSADFPGEYRGFHLARASEDPLVEEWIRASSLWRWSSEDVQWLREEFVRVLQEDKQFVPLQHFLAFRSIDQIEKAIRQTGRVLDPPETRKWIEESVIAIYATGRSELPEALLTSSWGLSPMVEYAYRAHDGGDQEQRQNQLLEGWSNYLPPGSFDPRQDPRPLLLRRLENFVVAEARLSAATIYYLLGGILPDRADLLAAIREDASSRFRGVRTETIFAPLRDQFTKEQWKEFIDGLPDFSKRAASVLFEAGRLYNAGQDLPEALLASTKNSPWDDLSPADRLRLVDWPPE